MVTKGLTCRFICCTYILLYSFSLFTKNNNNYKNLCMQSGNELYQPHIPVNLSCKFKGYSNQKCINHILINIKIQFLLDLFL